MSDYAGLPHDKRNQHRRDFISFLTTHQGLLTQAYTLDPALATANLSAHAPVFKSMVDLAIESLKRKDTLLARVAIEELFWFAFVSPTMLTSGTFPPELPGQMPYFRNEAALQVRGYPESSLFS